MKIATVISRRLHWAANVRQRLSNCSRKAVLNRSRIAYYTVLALFTVLFLWKGIMGIIYYDELEQSFRKQHVFTGREPFLTKAVVALQLLAGLLLLAGLFLRKIMIYGLGLAAAVLAAYTVYSQLVLFNAFGFDICTCIGWFGGMSWPGIFALNLCLLFISLFMLLVSVKERRPP